MKVGFINCPVISKQIKLTRKESLQVGQLLNKYHKGKTENVLEQLKDIFSPYIEKKFENTITDREYSKKDYMQELYLQLFESFSKSKKKFHPVSYIINKLNKIIPGKNEYVTLPNHITLEELTDADNTKHSAELLFTSETAKGLAKRTIGTSPVSSRAIKIIEHRLNNEQFSEIADMFDLSSQRVNQIYNKSMLLIKLTHNKKYRNEYYEKHPWAKRWYKEEFKNKTPGGSTRDLFESSQNNTVPEIEEQPIKKIKGKKSRKSKKEQIINIENTYPQKKITINSRKSWSMSDIEISDILVENDAIFKQSGIINGDVKNNGLYILTGVTKGNITNSGKLNLRGAVKGKIKNGEDGIIELSGIAHNISNDGTLNITGFVKGNIVNYGNIHLSGSVKGNIYTYNEIDISDEGLVWGKIVKLDD